MEYRTCTKCGQSKSVLNYPWKSQAKSRRHEHCRACRKAYFAQRYRDNPQFFKERDLKRKQIYKDLKTGPCTDCGQIYPPYVMDFDHRDPETKVFNVATWTATRWSLVRLAREIAKCDLVCSNCHRERSYGPNGKFRSKLWAATPLPAGTLPIDERLRIALEENKPEGKRRGRRPKRKRKAAGGT